MGADNIILGEGIFSVNGVDIALTRGGGSFEIEREYRQIEADGDFGPVKGRIRKIKSVCRLKLNALELLPSNLTKFYPAMDLDTADSGKDVLTAASDIADEDYSVVSFTGKTKAGKQVYIEIEDAINLENINWNLVDKEEVVPELTFTGAYDPDTRDEEPFKVEFTKGTTYSVTFNVDDGASDVEGASITFNNQTKLTDGDGQAVFTGAAIGNNQSFTIVAGGFQTYFGSVNVVNANVTADVTLTEL